MAFKRPTIGEMRHKIQLQSRTDDKSGTAGLTATYANVGSKIWARVRAIAGGALIEGVQETEAITHRFDIRHRTDQADWNYIELGTRRFAVRAVRDPWEDGRLLEIAAEEGAYGI